MTINEWLLTDDGQSVAAVAYMAAQKALEHELREIHCSDMSAREDAECRAWRKMDLMISDVFEGIG